jgi:hypothetical protein
MSAQERLTTTRSDDAFDANQRLAESAEALRFVSRVPMFCECYDPACRALVLITLDRYREVSSDNRLFLTAPGHSVNGAEPVEREADFCVQRVVG